MNSPESIPSATTPQTAGVDNSALARPTVEECWNRIGVQGDRSCPELAQYVQCRNCPVYAHAGALLLNRPLPPEYRREWTAHFANSKRPPVPANASVTIFRIGPEWLALDTALLQEVTERRPMHSVPHRRMGVVLGLVNVRGELFLCVSLARLLGLAYDICRERLRHEHLRLLVVQADSQRFAFPVDEVQGVHRFNLDELESPPATVVHAQRSFTRGVLRWRDHTVGCLDAEAVFFHLNHSLA